MSDVGRLPEAAAKLEERADHRDQCAEDDDWLPPRDRDYMRERSAEDRATAALLRAIQTGNFAVTVHAATALAAAVLGLPEDNERTAKET